VSQCAATRPSPCSPGCTSSRPRRVRPAVRAGGASGDAATRTYSVATHANWCGKSWTRTPRKNAISRGKPLKREH
jgi:hypothetical protein